jgi:hypothetical protein
VPVTTGIVEGEKTEIVAPVVTGLVVVAGQHLLDDHSPIIVPAASGAAGAQKTPAAGKQGP